MSELKACAFCKQVFSGSDLADILYPNGIVWRDDDGVRHYQTRKESKGFHGMVWEVHCAVTSGGCGATITGDSKIGAFVAWNRRTPDVNAELLEALKAVVAISDRKHDAWDAAKAAIALATGEQS